MTVDEQIQNVLHDTVEEYESALTIYDREASGFVRMLLELSLTQKLKRTVGTQPWVRVTRADHPGYVNVSFVWPLQSILH